MTRSAKHAVVLSLLLAGLVLPAFTATGKEMPEFGKSVVFDKTAPNVTISKLRGKAVIVVFFQSPKEVVCPWAKKMVTQAQEIHGTNPCVVLIALQTDCDDAKAARKTFVSLGGDPDVWLIGGDKNSDYSREVLSRKGLWMFALVGANGKIVKTGQAGNYYSAGPDAGRYMLTVSDVFKDCGELKSVLPRDKKYPDALLGVVRCAEMGCLAEAIKMCSSGGRTPAERKAAQALKKDIIKAAGERLEAKADELKDDSKDWGTRYESYKELDAMVKELRNVPESRDAQNLVLEMGRTPEIQREKTAESSYLRLMVKLEKAGKSQKARVRKELAALGARYSDTKYGKLAAKEGARTSE
jgi:hypothetical protein